MSNVRIRLVDTAGKVVGEHEDMHTDVRVVIVKPGLPGERVFRWVYSGGVPRVSVFEEARVAYLDDVAAPINTAAGGPEGSW